MGRSGRFIWHELATVDADRAKAFYAGLFGWTYEGMDGEFGAYTVIHAGGRGIGGMVAAAGAPVQWTAYVTVADVNAAARRAAAAGGAVRIPPSPIPTVGQFALVADPSGATIIPFLPDGPDQPEPAGPPPVGTVCWNELYTRDPEAAVSFYTSLFGWGHGTMDMGPAGAYHLFKVDGRDVAGMMRVPAENVRPQWLPYFAVADVDASFAAATGAGATAFLPPTVIPNVGRFAILADPAGATFAVFRG